MPTAAPGEGPGPSVPLPAPVPLPPPSPPPGPTTGGVGAPGTSSGGGAGIPDCPTLHVIYYCCVKNQNYILYKKTYHVTRSEQDNHRPT